VLQHLGQGHFDTGQFGQQHLSPEPGAAVAALRHPRLAHLGQKHFDQDHFGVALSGATGPTARLEHPRLAHLGQQHFDQDHFGVALSGVTPPPGPSGEAGDTFPIGWKSEFPYATFALGWVNRAVAPEPEPGPLPVGGMGMPIFRRGIDKAPHGDDDEVLMYVIRKFLERVDP
jgi:hypothetical protein